MNSPERNDGPALHKSLGRAGDIFVLNLTTLQYESALTSPYVEVGTFGGAAWSTAIPEPSALVLLLAGLAPALRRPRSA